jgi:LDH2 family malate/lactate/ureidoglycolate dehydrogenase
LAGALTNAGVCSAEPAPYLQGVFIVAIDVAGLRPLEDFVGDVEAFIDYVKDVPLEPGAGPVRIPGESSAANEELRRVAGIELPVDIWNKLSALAIDLGVAIPTPQ